MTAIRPALAAIQRNNAKANAGVDGLTAAQRRVLDPRLVQTAAEGKPVDALVMFKTPSRSVLPALNELNAIEQLPLGVERKTRAAKAIDTIASQVEKVQSPRIAELVKSGAVQGVDELWRMNTVRLRGASLDALKAIASSGTHVVMPDEVVPLSLPNAFTDSIEGAAATSPTETNPDEVFVGWGVKKMNADAAWKKGITGKGLTVYSLDTGVITDHPGLKANYRGTKPDGTQDHNYNWINVVDGSKPPNMDDVGHGTHTIGNTVGYHPNNVIGVAPDAKFIVGRGLGAAGGNMFGLIAAMDWAVAPTDLAGKKPRPELAPDISTNSWGGPGISNPFLWAGLRNWRRSGIIPVFAAGNTGRRPETPNGAVPASIAVPGLYGETITVGATEKDDSRAFFSNRGPSNYAKDVKPEVVAPGSMVYSAWTDGTFRDTFVIDGRPYPASGTSMATPHAAGAVALYMQANPNATYDEILGALTKTATHPGTPDNDTGYGRIQVDKLIAKVDKNAKLTDKARVNELLAAYDKAKVFGEKDAAAAPKQPAGKGTKKTG